MTIAALIVAGGSGRRFGGELPKQYRKLAGKPVLRHAVDAFLNSGLVDRIQVVIRDGDRAHYDAATIGLALPTPVTGGDTRQASVLCGLEALAVDPPTCVLIHDAARPFLSTPVIAGCVAALRTAPGAIVAVPLRDTLKQAQATSREIEGTVNRTALWRAQTPQAFRFAEILSAHRDAAGRNLTDDAAVAEATGLAVLLIEGSDDNIKITTEDDLARAERMLAAEREYRTGFGYDVHRFGPGTAVMLGGVRIAHDRGLEGHSDADVALHALTDAILGAIGAGDIGVHFSPADAKWKGADSAGFLAHAVSQIAERGGSIVHLDLTIVCERPTIGPHREAMVARIAAIAGLEPGRVSVKATTTEGLGFTGRGEGIAAQAVATVALPR